MKVGILGSGIVGQVLGAGFVKHGHQVMMGTRDPRDEEVRSWLAKTPGASAGAFAEAARFGDVLVLVVLGRVVEKVIALAGPENFAGKTVIDATNPLAEGPPVNGVLPYITGPNESLGEKIQALLPQARVVKAFNSVGNARMVNPHYEQGTPTMFLCGDSEDAKARVSEIIRRFGWEPFDCGGIIAARALEPLCMFWCIPGFLRNQWTHAFKVLTG
ncbi:MAG TPA: NAD(P)-binding domain-containing protein [Bryobacterales bacterium]|nr:NAD(P)-binding domain-containing protein [Bryobacterales bacterium]